MSSSSKSGSEPKFQMIISFYKFDSKRSNNLFEL